MAPSSDLTTKLSAYEIARLENIRRNNAFMASIGLSKAVEAAAACKPKPKKNPIAAARRKLKRKRVDVAEEDVRRSARRRGKPARYSGEEIDAIMSAAVRPSTKKRKSRKSRSAPAELTPAQRRLIETSGAWLDEFETFLLRIPHGRNNKVVSDANARSVMNQARKLVSGQGVGYHHWSADVLFRKDEPVTLASDFCALYADAVHYENTHGRDLGNGWLLRHPIMKLQCFQIHKFDQMEPSSQQQNNPQNANVPETSAAAPKQTQKRKRKSNQKKKASGKLRRASLRTPAAKIGMQVRCHFPKEGGYFNGTVVAEKEGTVAPWVIQWRMSDGSVCEETLAMTSREVIRCHETWRAHSEKK